MSIRAILITCLGAACGLFAVMGINQMRRSPLAASMTPPKVTKILVAKSVVPRGHVIEESMIKLQDWPADLVPDSALLESEKALGRIAVTKLIEGEPLLDGKLAPSGAKSGAGNLVRAGMRAYAILAANAASSVAGLILPGDRVDVILSIQTNMNDETGGGTSTTLLQNVEILAIDQELGAPAENRSDPGLSTVTLLVTPGQAALLALGLKAGVLSLALRNPEDDGVADTDPITLKGIRMRQEAPTATEPEKATSVAERVVASLTPSLRRKEPKIAKIRTLRGSHAGLISVADARSQ